MQTRALGFRTRCKNGMVNSAMINSNPGFVTLGNAEPPVPDSVPKRPVRNPRTLEMALAAPGTSAAPSAPPRERAVVAPLSEDTFSVQFTASRVLRDKLRRAQDLLRHRVPSGDMAAIFEKALDSLIERVEKERFAVVRNPRTEATEVAGCASSRQVPAAIRRHVYARDAGRCTFVDARGNRCKETGMLELDHLDGFARTHLHDPERIVMRCRAHDQHEAEKMYGREFMAEARAKKSGPSVAAESVVRSPVPERDATRQATNETIRPDRSARSAGP